MYYKQTLIFLLYVCVAIGTFSQTGPVVSFSQQGTVAANAIVLDATEIGEFHEGYAIIRKEQDFAMIDKDGNFFIPFGKFRFNERQGYRIDPKCGFINGMSIVRDHNTEQYGFINRKGELVVPCALGEVQPYMKDGFGWGRGEAANGAQTDYFFDKTGKRYPVKPNAWFGLSKNIPEKLYRCFERPNDNFYTKTGRLVFSTKRRVVSDYSDELIRVDSNIGLAGLKTGFIDTNNRLVIPYKFKGPIQDFQEGLAMLHGTGADEFRYAFINKNGDIVLKLKDLENGNGVSVWAGEGFSSGILMMGYGDRVGLMPVAGSFTPLDKLIPEQNPSFTNQYKAVVVKAKQRSENYIRFSADLTWQESKNFGSGGFNPRPPASHMVNVQGSGTGIADLKGKIIYEPVFYEIAYPDPVSGMSKASLSDRDGYNITTRGYVNGKGVFVMVMKSVKQ